MSIDYTKQILAVLRVGDFAHPGEIDAIELTLSSMTKNGKTRWLDVGCGLGGTADYIQQKGWGQVTGIDLDASLIQHAKLHHPDVQFICDDILKYTGFPSQSFQCIYSFSAFFCFASQETALKNLSLLAAPDATLILFDYSRPDMNSIQSPFPWSKTASRFSPIYLPELKTLLTSTGWSLQHSRDLSEHFIRWYTVLLQQFEQKRMDVERQFGKQAWNTLYQGYQQLLRDLNMQKIGGIVVYAKRMNIQQEDVKHDP